MNAEPQESDWLDRVEGLFLRFGVKSQTMDDISRELGISKKTLYQMVENKDDLVRKVLIHHISREKTECLEAASKASNAIEEILIVIESNSRELAQMKANVLYDLQKYHRDAWELIRAFHHDFVFKTVTTNLERGRTEGLYRSDFDIEILAKLHLATIFQLFDDTIFPTNTFPRVVVFREYMMHFLHGIVSHQGLSYLNSKHH
jgi:AcrR family transcriptional regulator